LVVREHMQRREFITLLGGAAGAWPLSISAQPQTPHIGVLLPGLAPAPRDCELTLELARLGYIEGRNIAYEVAGADGDRNRLPQLARELVAKNPEVYRWGRGDGGGRLGRRNA